jgi:hypothetical protein|nr:hypothetical protein [Kofleriaceae bacterium]
MLPIKAREPRFEVGGPVVLGDVAVVSTSQLGFAAVDWRRGQIAWTKPSGEHVAPPVVHAGDVVLIGSCAQPPAAPDTLLGCLRSVTAVGADHAYVAIHGPRVAEFAAELGPQATWSLDDRHVAWRRGDRAVSIDTLTGVAQPIADLEPTLAVHYKDKTWTVTHAADGTLVAAGTPPWHTTGRYGTLVGAVYLPDQAPMVRTARAGAFGGSPEITLFDIDGTGSLHGQVAFPVPGIAILASAASSVGDAALAIRLDRSLRRDFIVGYAANALIMWVYPLPEQQRPDPVGVAIASEAVVVFHDGDTVTILPELSAPPTAPGAIRAPLENATP